MYVNKSMSTIKIADKLNEKEILAPAIYLDITTFRNRKSSNPKGKYIWLPILCCIATDLIAFFSAATNLTDPA